MWYVLVAVAVGLVAGLVAGGRLRNVAAVRIRGWGILPIALALQAIPELISAAEGSAFAYLGLSYVALAAFALLNLHLVGMAVVAVGLALNVVPVFANEGMPVRAEAAVAAGVASWEELERIEFDPKHHLETDEDRVTVLGDIIPVRPLGEVLSFGDLVMAVGVADVVFRLLRPQGTRRRRAQGSDADGVIDLTSVPASAGSGGNGNGTRPGVPVDATSPR